MTGTTAPAPALDGFGAAVCALAGPGAASAAAALGCRLLGLWRSAGRGYHDVEHLAEVLARLRELDVAGAPAAGAPVVRLAAWFHDAVYQGRPGEDERASAALAAGELAAVGVPGAGTAEVARLVLLTRDHQPDGDDPAGQALCDADLAILAAPPQRYARYRRDVRRDYRHVPEPLFRAGRRRVIAALLRRAEDGRLFHTAPAQGWNARAVVNLSGELRELGADPA